MCVISKEKEDRGELARARPPANGGLFHSHSTELTPAERKIAELLLCGQSNEEIATTLSRSPSTINYHICSMIEKFELDRRKLCNPRVKLALLIHEWRNILGVRCQTCEHLADQLKN